MRRENRGRFLSSYLSDSLHKNWGKLEQERVEKTDELWTLLIPVDQTVWDNFVDKAK